MWRPKNWKFRSMLYESGADAMLEALRKQAQHIDNTTAGNIVGDYVTIAALKPNCFTALKVLQWGEKGMVVFIPDE